MVIKDTQFLPTVNNKKHKKSRPSPKRRAQLRARATPYAQNKLGQANYLSNKKITDTWTGAEWEQPIQQELEDNHCPDCHLPFKPAGDFHWACNPIPGLDSSTCSLCNTWDAVNPKDKYPFLSIVTSPYFYPNELVLYLRNVHLTYDYLPPFTRLLINLVVFMLAFVLARYF